ncbi:tail fiber assembly protein [Kluyvera cryocrescens]|uniref:tail fiber assembly protein n=1 Tax=Kluyvera cryocrescens TaxID=580 RepID=UPI0039F646D5
MTDLFDVNGNATETHVATISGFDFVTGEHLSTYDVRILAGTGIPGYSTLTLAPVADDGYAVCWDGSAWAQVEDLRGKTAYKKIDRSTETVRTLGPLDDAYTLLPPSTPYDKWDGSEWVTDADAQHAADVVAAELKKTQLLAEAAEEISWRKYAVDKGIATAEEVAELDAWEMYRVRLMRVVTSNAPDIEWPTPPDSQG